LEDEDKKRESSGILLLERCLHAEKKYRGRIAKKVHWGVKGESQ